MKNLLIDASVPGARMLSDISLVHSHWSRNVEARLSLVERIIVMLRQLSYAIKNQLGHPKPACSSLVLYGIRAPIIGELA